MQPMRDRSAAGPRVAVAVVTCVRWRRIGPAALCCETLRRVTARARSGVGRMPARTCGSANPTPPSAVDDLDLGKGHPDQHGPACGTAVLTAQDDLSP